MTYQGLVNVVDAAKEARFTGRFMLLSGMGSEFPSFTGKLLNAIKSNLQRNQRTTATNICEMVGWTGASEGARF